MIRNVVLGRVRPDAAACGNYDADAEHNRYRAQVAAVCSDIARAQFETD